MDDMESLPKDFVKKSEIVPIGNHGISSLNEFQRSEEHIYHVEWLKSIGLSQEEISLYEDHKAGVLSRQIESEVLQSRLDRIFKKISDNTNEATGSNNNDVPSTSSKNTDKPIENLQDKSTKFYPEGHPMHSIHELEKDMFGHLQDDNILPLNKRRKMLRHLERRKERAQDKKILFDHPDAKTPKPGSLWDVKEPCQMPRTSSDTEVKRDAIGPKKPTMYTVKDNKIVRLEPIAQEDKVDEYRVMDIVIPVNEAEERLLEGTKMSLDDIKKIERFKDYEPGIPSKTLYLKNIAASVSKDQLSLLFNQFVQDNRGPIDVRLMSSMGAMRGQAFVAFQNEDTSIRALDEVNGTILAGQPIIAQFGRHSNRIHDG